MRIGYFGVIVPTRPFWQGFFLTDGKAEAEAAAALLAELRQQASLTCMGLSAVRRGLDGAPPEAQPLIGALSAMVVDRAIAEHHPSVGLCALALHQATGLTHFLVVADEQAAGTATEVVNLGAATDEAVRAAIDAHPGVVAGKRRLWEQAVQKGRPEPHWLTET